jgi:hypothetical protein
MNVEHQINLFSFINSFKLKINSNKIISKGNKRNPLENLSFFWKNGSHSEMEISGCDTCTWLFTWVRHIIDLLHLVSKDKWVATMHSTHVFDFNHTEIVFLSTTIGIKPITIEEHYF